MSLSSTPGSAKKMIYLESKKAYVPLQVSGDTKTHPNTKTLPTLGKLLTVCKGERFLLPNNILVQWLLVERDIKHNDNKNENDDDDDIMAVPLWGFVPVECLTPESRAFIGATCSMCKFNNQEYPQNSLLDNAQQQQQHGNFLAKQENSLMVLKLARTEQQLHEALEKNKLLNQRSKDEHSRITLSMHQLLEQLVEKGEHLEDAKRQIDVLNAKLDREMQCSSELYHKVKDLELLLEKFKTGAPPVVTDDNDNELLFNSSIFDESLEQLEEHLKRSSTPIGDLMLSCTLCNERIRIEELESHSSKCSADSARKVKNGKEIKPSPQPMLVATVTCARRESMQANIDTDCPFKVICKTTIPEFKKTLLTCERTKEDFEWFRKALEEFHPERVIPPLTFHYDLTVNLREIQRFLSRICSHKILKGDPLVRKFFTATHKELEKFKKSFHKKIPKYLKHQKPAIEVVDKDGILCKTQIYIAQLIENLLSLTEFFKTNNDNKTIDSLSKCFLQLSAGETNETYLKTVANGLSGIIAELENKKNVIYDESVLAEDLESILEFVKSADELLYRVECSVNTFLYWEEEIRVFEEMKSEGLVTSTNGKDITQLWAEASSNCRTAKEELEYMCRQLSEELSEFDIRKEQELKQIFIEYAESRCDVFEKMQSKWFGVKLMLNTDIVPDMRAVDFKK